METTDAGNVGTDDFLSQVLADSGVRGPACSVHTILLDLEAKDPPTADGLRRALEHPQATNAAITRKLKDKGYRTTDTTIARHRRHDCKCPK